MRELGDVCRHKHGGDAQSVAAWLAGSGRQASDREKILVFLEKRGGEGATSDEVAALWGVANNRVSGRFSELQKLGLIEPSGELRLTRCDRQAKVFVLKAAFDRPPPEPDPPPIEAPPVPTPDPAPTGCLF